VPLAITTCYAFAASHGALRILDRLNDRPIFFVRYIAWLLTVPVLILETECISGQPLWSSGWVAVLTEAYMLCSFGALLAPTHAQKWFWILVTFCTTATAINEAFRVLNVLQTGSSKCFKTYKRYVYIMNGAFLVYGAVYILAALNLVSPIFENSVYGICDIISKALFTSFIFNAFMNSLYLDLRNSKRYTEDIFDKSEAPMFVVRCEDTVVTRCNEAMARTLQRKSTDLVGKPLLSEFLASSSKAARQAFDRALNEEVSLQEKISLNVSVSMESTSDSYTAPLEPVELFLSINRTINARGEEVLMCVGQDVTELQNFRKLETKKAEMLAVVSHELRSPLHGIIGISDAVQRSVTKSIQKRQLRIISDCGKRLLDFVSTMMDITAMQRNKDFALNEEVLDIVKLLDDVAALLLSANDKYGRPVVKKNVKLICNFRATRLPTLRGDAHRLTQVFFNIIGNGLKFTEEGSVMVSTGVESRSSGDMSLVVLVKDTGKGIDPNALTTIFEPFEQEDTTDTRQHDGLGLGLAISREIVRSHGGDIVVQSEVGVGSTFCIKLPIKELNDSLSDLAEENQNSSLGSPVLPGTGTTPGTGKSERAFANFVRVLSVDDEPLNQEVIECLFEDAPQFAVEFAMSGKEGIEKLLASAFDIVLLDLMMPGMSGLEVLKTIRQTPQLHHLPVVIISAKNSGQVIADAMSAGATDFFVKSFDPPALLDRINRILNAPLGGNFSPAPLMNSTPLPDRGAMSPLPFQSKVSPPTLYAAMVIVFTVESYAAMSQLEAVLIFVDRTVETVAERSWRNADGSMVILAEGRDGEMRLRRIEKEIRAWFAENAEREGVRMETGIAPPAELVSAFVVEQFIAMGGSVGGAKWRALGAAYGKDLDMPLPPKSKSSHAQGITDAPSDASTQPLAAGDDAREACASSSSNVRCIPRLSELMRAQCAKEEARLAELMLETARAEEKKTR
jgi:signal transduction histidine kinase/CheY-like chemotaxis protein